MSAVPDNWYETRTYHHRQFEDIERLVSLKQSQGLTYSVCLPTLNVSSTIGEIIRVFRTELMERYPLIDQLAIIDSHSTDGTEELAASQGAEVYYDDEILPDIRAAQGKGEALWKSLFVLGGDIIAWVDSDIRNIHPRFAYGILGPLLDNPQVDYVKAFYRRPITEAGHTEHTGGGRVTELVVRPSINLFYPELSGLVQPLSGEYAGRRKVLEKIPFLTGYGVETGMLLDIYSRYGLGSIAQVDLEVREHRNQSLHALSKMAFAVMQAIFVKLDYYGKVSLREELVTVYNSIEYDEGGYQSKPVTIEVIERPPAVSLDRYRDTGED